MTNIKNMMATAIGLLSIETTHAKVIDPTKNVTIDAATKINNPTAMADNLRWDSMVDKREMVR